MVKQSPWAGQRVGGVTPTTTTNQSPSLCPTPSQPRGRYSLALRLRSAMSSPVVPRSVQSSSLASADEQEAVLFKTTRHCLWELWAYLAQVVIIIGTGLALFGVGGPFCAAIAPIIAPLILAYMAALSFFACFFPIRSCGARHFERLNYRVEVTPVHVFSTGSLIDDPLSVAIEDIALAQSNGCNALFFCDPGVEIHLKGPDGRRKLLTHRSFGVCYHDGNPNGVTNCFSRNMPPDHVIGPCLNDRDGLLQAIDYAVVCSNNDAPQRTGAGKQEATLSRSITVEVLDDGSSWEGVGLRNARVQKAMSRERSGQ